MTDKRGWWNTYHPLGMNRIVRFPELYEVRFSVYAPLAGAYTSKFHFLEHFGDAGNVLKAAPHSADCSFASAEFSFAGYSFRLSLTCNNDSLSCEVVPLAVADPHTLVLVEALRAWDEGEVELEGDGIISFPAREGTTRLRAIQDDSSVHNPGTPICMGTYSSEEDLQRSLFEAGVLNGKHGRCPMAVLAFSARRPLYLEARDERARGARFESDTGGIRAGIVQAGSRCAQSSPAIKGGPYEGCYQAVSSVMNWMTVWDSLHGLAYTPVSRSWIDTYMVRAGLDPAVRGPLTGLWDCFFHGILHSVNDRCLAESNLRVALGDHALLEEGYPPNYMVSTFLSGDRSQPPLGSLAAWKIFRRFGNSTFLEWIYPRLKKWRGWWRTRRDGNKDGLLEWGSDPRSKRPGNDAGTLYAAKCESGMDNSPLYDDAGYDERSGTMMLTDVGLNSLFAADALFLSRIAAALGKFEDQQSFEREYNGLAKRIDETLWNEENGAYMDRFWNGDFTGRLGPTSFYPLLAGIPTRERAERIIRSHLMNPDEFWGEFVIPAISRNDPAFRDQLYWRGRIWPPVNYLVYLGLRNYGCDDAAHELALRSVRLFMREWNLMGHCHENYNAVTGEGDDVPIAASPCSNGSDRFYPWGALLALMGIEELFDVEPEGGIRFGCFFLGEETDMTNIPYGEAKYRIITSSARTVMFRDNCELFSSMPGTKVRHFESGSNAAVFSVAGVQRTSFRISGFAPDCGVVLHQEDGTSAQLQADPQGAVTFDIPLSLRYTKIRLAGVVPRLTS